MVRLLSRRGWAAIVLGLALAGPAAIAPADAQSAMPGGAMPLPPSANDPPPKNNAAASPNKPARAAKTTTARKKAGVSEPYGGGGNGSYTDRIDTRPARGDMQLEDDPRVKPTMDGGRPGIGMRF